MSYNLDKPNRLVVSTRAEQKAALLEREPVQRLLTVMNSYHSLDSMFFPVPKMRDEAKANHRTILKKISEELPQHLKNRVQDAIKSKRVWDEMKEHIF